MKLLFLLFLFSCSKERSIELPCTYKIDERVNVELKHEVIECMKVRGYVIYGHPLMMAKYTDRFWFDKCENFIEDKVRYYGPNDTEVWAIQIGGTQRGWYQHEATTYFIILPKDQYDSLSNGDKWEMN